LLPLDFIHCASLTSVIHNTDNNAFNKKNEANTNAAADTESNKTDKVPEEVVPAVESPKANDEETNEECTEALVTGSLAENKAVLCEIMKTMFEEHFTALNKKLDMLLEQGCAELSPTNEPMHDGFESEKEAAASPTSETTVKVGDTVNYLSNSSMGKVKRINLAEVEWDNKGKAKYEDMNKLTVYDPNAKRPRRSVFPDGASSKKQKN
jgi:plastocyanin